MMKGNDIIPHDRNKRQYINISYELYKILNKKGYIKKEDLEYIKDGPIPITKLNHKRIKSDVFLTNLRTLNDGKDDSSRERYITKTVFVNSQNTLIKLRFIQEDEILRTFRYICYDENLYFEIDVLYADKITFIYSVFSTFESINKLDDKFKEKVAKLLEIDINTIEPNKYMNIKSFADGLRIIEYACSKDISCIWKE